MPVKVNLDLITRDQSGNVVDVKHSEGHSFVQGFIFMLCYVLQCSYGGAGSQSNIKDTGGTVRAVLYGAGNMSTCMACEGPTNQQLYGIVVGSGSTAPAYGDYQLTTLIANGSGSGQLNYEATTNSSPVNTSGNTMAFTITRTFINNSGATITVNEVGMICSSQYGSGTQGYFLILHDLSTIAVAASNTLTVVYSISTTT